MSVKTESCSNPSNLNLPHPNNKLSLSQGQIMGENLLNKPVLYIIFVTKNTSIIRPKTQVPKYYAFEKIRDGQASLDNTAHRLSPTKHSLS